MLRSMRNGLFSKFFLIILALGGLGLVLADGGGFFRSGPSATDVAKIGDKNIHIAEFDRSLRMLLRKQGITPKQAYQAGMINQYLGQELNRTAVRQEANDIGLVLSKERLAETIGTILEPMVANGMTKEEAFERLLQMSNMSEKDLMQEIREDKTSQILYKAIAPNTIPVSDVVVKSLAQLQNHTRTIEFLKFAHKDVKGIAKPTDEELSKYYETVKSGYSTPETRDLSLLIIDNDLLKDSVQISDTKIEDFYNDNISDFTSQERRELHQSIFETEETALSVIDKFKTDLESTVKDVTGDSKAFVGVQSFNKEDLLEDISKEVFKANNEEVVGPIKTALGWHVFQVTAIMKPVVTSLSDVKDSIEDELLQDELSEELYSLAEELDDRLVGGEDIAVLVKELPVKEVKLDAISTLDGARMSKLDVQDQQRVLKDSFEIYEGENTPIEEFSDGRFFTVYVHKINPSIVPSLEKIKEQIVKTWMNNKKKAANFAKAQSIRVKVESGETKISSMNPTVKTVKKSDTPPFGLTPYAMETFFTAKQGDIKMTTTADGVVIGYLKSVNIPEAKEISKTELDITRAALEQQAAQEILSTYVGHLQLVRNTQINDEIIDKYYGQEDKY